MRNNSNSLYLLDRKSRSRLQPAFIRCQTPRPLRRRSLDEKDEGLIQYMIILVLIAVCTIAIFTFLAGQMMGVFLTLGAVFGGCLGAALARMEMNSLFTELIPRLEAIELAGEPELAATTFVGGLKHLPIRYSLK